ncbi:BDM_1a_G0031790.mRNA.1.CDS.1 [Saccharomyces cerevisiae]|nr:AHG_G0025700.mRNA.1.CDS.1 [Saccharomyces cerevisiae]CAI4578401.1 BDM_1a_G0031790.mRNA.1.CDS.1 [Saccharomyces cerevisiae]CAI6720646.1 AHG_G0025700.mRNA.1.CDS.1 [Saccharomyces cerevisiae]CAI7196796.1 BDM_1a_G0031790.mRNA.1.CDS.1 [Saccharomyces cerevisiae]
MQWSSEEPNDGFFGPESNPWLYLNDSLKNDINVEDEHKHSNSELNFWKNALYFIKKCEGKTSLAALNFSYDEINFRISNDNSPYYLAFGNWLKSKVNQYSRILGP